MKFIVIGITDNTQQHFAPQVLHEIGKCTVFSGGQRHHELVRHLLPAVHQWIDVTVPLKPVYEAYNTVFATGGDATIMVFASGDPLFYGYATTLRRQFPDADIQVWPTFNSLQMLAHRMLLPYQDMRCVSITGRPWKGLDDALIRGERMIGVLTDRHMTPLMTAQRMLQYGYDNYTMTIGECMGNPTEERVRSFSLQDVPACVRQPVCVILQQTHPRHRQMGIPESEFHLLDGRINMITKAPIRLLTLSALDLAGRHTLWDVGFCTGSVSIEARLQYPHLHIESFEIRPEGEELIRRNSQRHGAPGIEVHIGDFMQTPLDALPRPDAVFIGGHGGKLPQMIERIRQYLQPGGVIVFNSVSEQSQQMFRQAVGACLETRIAVDGHNPIVIMKTTI